ncbi:MAG: antibiotic biosynthesis monooxygenase [Bacteroidia bacterium]|nr:antibiotic biosynthesis monooxygenase [Bacteroidia bacterium]
MIIRIVQMKFLSGKEAEFLVIFRESSEKIQHFPGCRHLELWQDPTDTQMFMTYSIWESEEDLNRYRQSPLFVETWSKTKKLFSEKPTVRSLRQVWPFTP